MYDRAGSSIACATADLFDFDAIFRGCGLVSFTGITPALSDSAAKLTEGGIKRLQSPWPHRICGFKFPQKALVPGKAREVMTNLMQYVDICIGNEGGRGESAGLQAGGQ